MVLLRGLDTAAAGMQAEALRVAVADGGLRHDYSSTGAVTISLGVARTTPQADGDPQSLIQRADAALYRAKLAGRNRVADPLT